MSEVDKFVVIQTPGYNGYYSIILSDFKFWARNMIELEEWCKAQDGVFLEGVIVNGLTKDDVVIFKLSWA